MARERSYRHDIRCRHCGSNWMPKDGHTRAANSQARRLQAEVHGESRAAALSRSKSSSRRFKCVLKARAYLIQRE